MSNTTSLAGRWTALGESRRGRRLLRAGRALLTIGILGFLIYQLRGLEIAEVARGLPRTPGFYLLLITLYCLLPTVQLLAYRISWRFDLRPAISAFIKKRILNKDVLGYSGEVYIFTWARDHVALPAKSLWETVRDMNIISAAASTFMAVLLLTVFVLQGQVNIKTLLGETQAIALAGGLAFTVILVLVVLRLRRYLFTMRLRPAAAVFGLHTGRMLVRQILEISMWHLAMPEIPVQVWFTYAAVSIIVTRIPFLPSQDLVTMGLAVSISGIMNVSEAHIFALFGAIALVNRCINLLFFAALSISMHEKRTMRRVTKAAEAASLESTLSDNP